MLLECGYRKIWIWKHGLRLRIRIQQNEMDPDPQNCPYVSLFARFPDRHTEGYKATL
jgi:hypothetical protein